MADLVLVKLGGSVITDKTLPYTAHETVVRRIGGEIREAIGGQAGTRIVIGHGSGSFGHSAAGIYRTHEGVVNDRSWYGLAETARAAGRLNRLVTYWLFDEGLPVMSFQPSASALCHDRHLIELDITALEYTLNAGLVPIVYGDVAMDEVRGFTIISTEQIFTFLAKHLATTRIVLAGIVDGVFDADPLVNAGARLFRRVTPASWRHVRLAVGGSHATDVTGGMASKVQAMVELVAAHPGLSVHVVSGAIPGRVRQAVLGDDAAGTIICADVKGPADNTATG